MPTEVWSDNPFSFSFDLKINLGVGYVNPEERILFGMVIHQKSGVVKCDPAHG